MAITGHERLTPEQVASGSLRLAEPRLFGNSVSWAETRPEESGRTTVVGFDCASGRYRDWVPAPFSARSRVHDYGGGAYCVGADGLYFVNGDDQGLYHVRDTDVVREIVPGREGVRYGDLFFDPAHARIVAVVEDHRGQVTQNYLTGISIDSGAQRTLFDASDFVSSFCTNEAGTQASWLSWNHPHMPWTQTSLWRGDLAQDGSLVNAAPVALPEGSVFQPTFGPDGRLYFVSDHEGAWYLYRIEAGQCQPLWQGQGECGMPQWGFRMSSFGFVDSDRVALAVTDSGSWQVITLDLVSGRERRESRLRSITHVDGLAARDGRIVVVGGGSSLPQVVAVSDRIDPVIRRAHGIEPASVARPVALTFPTEQGEDAHGFLYQGAASRALLLLCHGGPTGAASTSLDLRLQLFVEAGFAVFDVNYRGSTGFGRSYRERLYGGWGRTDVADMLAARDWIQHETGIDSAAIRGSSAGGFTVLAALAQSEGFAAAASYYGVAEIESLFAHTAKFESHYDRWLLGPDRAAASKRVSPLYHAGRITTPTILFQGLKDEVVPPSQSDSMYRALKDNGVACEYVTFENEGHGFRDAATIASCLHAELAFYDRFLPR